MLSTSWSASVCIAWSLAHTLNGEVDPACTKAVQKAVAMLRDSVAMQERLGLGATAHFAECLRLLANASQHAGDLRGSCAEAVRDVGNGFHRHMPEVFLNSQQRLENIGRLSVNLPENFLDLLMHKRASG